MMMNTRRAVLLLASGFLVACASSPVQQAASTLAPSGHLRIAVYPGSPTSLMRSAGQEDRGLSVEIGKELARQLGVPADLVVFDRVALVVDALQAGTVDMTITNATPARAALVDFTEPVVGLELGYLALPGSPVTSLALVDQPGVRIGVTEGSSSLARLSKSYVHAKVVPAPSLKAAAEMLKSRQIDAFATNKGILYELSDGLEGARILDGRWGVESLAIAVPKGRDAARPFLQKFADQVRAKGLVREAAARAGLRGLAEPGKE